MSRKSFQKVTLSVELTLPSGAKAKDAPLFLRRALITMDFDGLRSFEGLRVEQSVIKILKRETIYTS